MLNLKFIRNAQVRDEWSHPNIDIIVKKKKKKLLQTCNLKDV